jgi:hypothetical protein
MSSAAHIHTYRLLRFRTDADSGLFEHLCLCSPRLQHTSAYVSIRQHTAYVSIRGASLPVFAPPAQTATDRLIRTHACTHAYTHTHRDVDKHMPEVRFIFFRLFFFGTIVPVYNKNATKIADIPSRLELHYQEIFSYYQDILVLSGDILGCYQAFSGASHLTLYS